MIVDPRFIAWLEMDKALKLERNDPRLTISFANHPGDTCLCWFDIRFFHQYGFPLHERRKAVRWIEIKWDDLLLARQPVCGKCDRLEFLKVEGYTL